MKKIAVLFIVFTMFCLMFSNAYAENVGDLSGIAYYSAIDTYINNYPIFAYNLDGRQLICAEDLRNYGFSVDWDPNARTLSIWPVYETQSIELNPNIKRQIYMQYKRAFNVLHSDIKVLLCGNEIPSYATNGQQLIRIRDLESLGSVEYSFEQNCAKAWINGLPQTDYKPLDVDYDAKMVIVIDAGHGKSSGAMSYEEKINEGYTQKDGSWGEWRHWKNGSACDECCGDNCNHNRTCWYPIGNGDRETEPTINLRNAEAAKYYLENELHYSVRMTRESNEQNPSFSKRVSYCYPNNDLTAKPDAACYICVHSNAGGGRGSSYIAAERSSNYTQKWIDNAFVSQSNELGNLINRRIGIETSLRENGPIGNEGWLILFNKTPIVTAYMEIGFFDSQADLNILNSEYDRIGKAIAYGVNDYLHQ